MSSSKRYPPIKYTSRDFNSIRSDLIDYAKRYYPNTFQDFSESGFGALMVDSVSYIGDILSFYLDYSVNESFLDSAIEYENVIKIGRQMGYRFGGNPASFGIASFYLIVPGNTASPGINADYLPTLKKGTELSSLDGLSFTLNEDVNFADPKNEIVVARVNSNTGAPTSFAVKVQGQVVSGRRENQEIPVGSFKKFLNIALDSNNITEIISVFDSEGNEYFEVDYLSQDVVYKATKNRGSDNTVTQENLRPFTVPRRFVVQREMNTTFLQFGFGSSINNNDVESLTDPSTTVLKVHGKDYFPDANFDPTNLVATDKLGVGPSDTTLTIIYRTNDAENVNISANALVNVDTAIFEFPDLSILDSQQVLGIENSLEVVNEEPITGDVTLPTTEELKTRIYNVFSSQNRAVTIQDYKTLAYSMPPQFGAIKRASVVRDAESFKRNLNMYLVSEGSDGKLSPSNSAIKQNLKIWLDQGRMINDTVDILDAKIINLGIEFTAIASLESNKYNILTNAIGVLTLMFERKFEIGEPFYITDIFSELNRMAGIIDVTRVKLVQKVGENYSSHRFDVDANMSDDGRYLKIPNNVVVEVKYPEVDIKGTIK